MARQVVHDGRVAGQERGGEYVGHVGAEDLTVHCTIEQPRRGDAAAAQACRDGRAFFSVPAVRSGGGSIRNLGESSRHAPLPALGLCRNAIFDSSRGV